MPITSGETEMDSAARRLDPAPPTGGEDRDGHGKPDRKRGGSERHDDRPKRRLPDQRGHARERPRTPSSRTAPRGRSRKAPAPAMAMPSMRRARDVSPGQSSGGRSRPPPISPPRISVSARRPAATQIPAWIRPSNAARPRSNSKPERLVDRKLHSGGARAAAEDQRDGEARGADQENDHERPRQHRAQDRDVRNGASMSASEKPTATRPAGYARTEPTTTPEGSAARQAGCSGRQCARNDARQTVDRDRASACGLEPRVQPSRPPEDRQKPEDRDDHRQNEGRPHQRHEKPAAARKAAGRASARATGIAPRTLTSAGQRRLPKA